MPRRHDRGLGRPVQRTDRIAWRVDQSRKRPGPGGSLDVPGVATRAGVFVYDDERGTVRELRPSREVMDPESLATMVGVALTLQHPGQGQDSDHGHGEVTPENFRTLTHGTVLSAQGDAPEPGLVEVWTRLQSLEIQRAAQGGTVELSGGYEAVLLDPFDPANAEYIADLGPEPGVTHEGERYDLIQTHIRYNHLAVVDQARAGPVARLRMDGKAMTKKIKITIKRDGKATEAKAPGWILPAFEAAAIEPDKRADAGETLEVMIEGMEKALVLPKEMVDQMLAVLGMGASSEPSAPPPEPESDAGDPEMFKVDQEPEEEEPEEPRADAAGIQAMVDRAIRKQLAKIMPQAARKIADSVTATARERQALDRAALPILGQRFDYAAVDQHGLAIEVLRAVESPRLTQAEALAGRARKGDGIAAGRLAQMMDDAIDCRRDEADSSGDLGAAMFDMAAMGALEGRQDGADERPSWEVRAEEKRKRKSRKDTRPAA